MSTKLKYSEFPTPELKGRQEVRDILSEFFKEMDKDFNPIKQFEKLANDLIDLAVKEAKDKQ